MGNLLVVATLSHVSGFAEDSIQNTFCIDTPAGPVVPGDLGEVTTAVANFYGGSNAVGDSIGEFYGPGVSRVAGAVSLDCYDITGKLGGAPHGSPVMSDAMTFPAASSSGAVPEEVALVLSLRASGWASQPIEAADGADADSLVDRPRQRYTGRIYLGPFHPNAVATFSSKARPISTLRDAILDASVRLNDALLGRSTGPYVWSVWSRKDAATRPLSHVFVDDAFDTQRRRGAAPVIRTTVAL